MELFYDHRLPNVWKEWDRIIVFLRHINVRKIIYTSNAMHGYYLVPLLILYVALSHSRETTMPTVRFIQTYIAQVEGFEVTILHEDGRPVNSDVEGLPAYWYQRAAPNNWTVDTWYQSRFRPIYPGFSVTVWLLDGRPAPWNMRLVNVRDW